MQTWHKIIGAKCPNDQLAHYTSFEVLRSVLDNKEIWATNILRQNDEVEFSYGFTVLAECLHIGAQRAEDKEKMSLFVKFALEAIPSFQFRHIHTVSFSSELNLLSQWRGYTSKGGVSIVFDYNHLKAIAKKEGHKLFKCTYDKDEQRAVAAEVIHKHTKNCSQFSEANSETDLLELARDLVNHFAFFSPFFKHPSFAEEQEWRMMISGIKGIPYPHKQVEFRAVANTLKPVYKLPLLIKQTKPGSKHQIGIDYVIVGPVRHANLVADAVDGLFDELNVSTKEFAEESGIPYRAD